MKKLLKSLLSQQTMNYFYHLPKAVLANFIYGFPTRKLKVIGITGTDGKTTTTNMVYQIIKNSGKKVSMISSVNAVISGKSYDTGFHVTSPDPFTLQKLASQAKNDEYLVLEVTSHALDQYRAWGIKFDVGIVTNITHEHLDYHKTLINYLNTKLKLLKEVKFAIVNFNLKDKIKKVGGKKIITFGMEKGDFNQKDVCFKLKLAGDYNIENALASLACAFVLDIDKKIARKTLEEFFGVKGRMEEIKNNKNIRVVVDFAHTPNALLQALTALKKTTKGRLIAVFGAAGKRDVGKRKIMGKIAAQKANITVITAEDPRGELDLIIRQITSGAYESGARDGINLFIVKDRAEAINFAIKTLAKRGDTVGIFGKGHELSMNIDGREEIPWSDIDVAKKALD